MTKTTRDLLCFMGENEIASLDLEDPPVEMTDTAARIYFYGPIRYYEALVYGRWFRSSSGWSAGTFYARRDDVFVIIPRSQAIEEISNQGVTS